jgi:hypothetical protein
MIDPKKIEEWTELVRIDGLPYISTTSPSGRRAPGDAWNELEFLAERSELFALLREVQLAPLRAQDGRALVTLDLETLRRIAAATGG